MDRIRIRAEFDNGNVREVCYVAEIQADLLALFEALKRQARDKTFGQADPQEGTR